MAMSEVSDLPTNPELTAALRDCLPSSLGRQCLLGDEIRDPAPCVPHLAALLRAVSSYLPRQVVVPLLANPQPGQVEGWFTHGTVMFADISGFTALSEKLSQLGKEGAEEITAIVNRFFAALLEVTDHYGGDLLKFGGDAMLLFFGGADHALRACLAALRMQETMADLSETHTSQGVFHLRMHIGLGSGPLFMAHLGSEEGMEFTVMGRAMGQMAQAEDQATAGEVFMDSTTHRAVAGQALTGEIREGFCHLVGFREDTPDLGGAPEDPLSTLPPLPTGGDDVLPWITGTVQRIRALELFLPPGLMDKIKLEPERITIGGEYRPVTMFFANFYGIDEIIEELGETRSAEITAILNAHFTTMRRIIARYGGVVNKVDSYAVGHRIMAFFGAPRAHIDDPERTVRAALEMQEAMAAFAELDTSCGFFFLKQRIGVNTGLVFAGNVGSPTRPEYSVMGGAVNLTARLMAVATDGQVLINQSTARQAGDAFLLHEQEPVRVKGISLPVHNYEVLGLQERRARAVHRHPLIGRDAEWQTVHGLTDLALGGETRVLTIAGAVGLGKSRFLEEVTAHWSEEHGALSIGATCPSFGRHTPYLPWLDILRAFFGFDPADSNQVRLEKIEALLVESDPTWRDWTVLIGRLLGLEVEETGLVRALDAQTRQRVIFQVVSGLVEHVAGEQPLLLVVDDLQWADDTSVALVNQVGPPAGGDVGIGRGRPAPAHRPAAAGTVRRGQPAPVGHAVAHHSADATAIERVDPQECPGQPAVHRRGGPLADRELFGSRRGERGLPRPHRSCDRDRDKSGTDRGARHGQPSDHEPHGSAGREQSQRAKGGLGDRQRVRALAAQRHLPLPPGGGGTARAAGCTFTTGTAGRPFPRAPIPLPPHSDPRGGLREFAVRRPAPTAPSHWRVYREPTGRPAGRILGGVGLSL
jgi:class 3 adenylate cyclase